MLLVAHFLADKSGDNGADDDETFSSDDGDGNATTQVDVDFDDIDDDCVVEGAVERCSPRARAKQLLVVFFGAAATNAQLRALSSWALIPVMRRVQYWRRRSSPFAHISSPLLAGRLLTSLHAQSLEHLTSARVLLAEALSCPAGKSTIISQDICVCMMICERFFLKMYSANILRRRTQLHSFIKRIANTRR